jgi:hypothetical protein
MRVSVDQEAPPGVREPEPSLAARVPAAFVKYRRPGEEHRIPPETPGAERQIGIFEIQLEARVEAMELFEQAAADHQARAGDVVHLARLLVIPLHHPAAAEARRREQGQPRHLIEDARRVRKVSARRLTLAARVDERQADDAGARPAVGVGLHRLDRDGERMLFDLRVGIEEQHVIGGAADRALIAAGRKSHVLRVGDHHERDPGAPRLAAGRRKGRLRCVVDDDHAIELEARTRGARQRRETALEPRAAIPVDDHDIESRRRIDTHGIGSHHRSAAQVRSLNSVL